MKDHEFRLERLRFALVEGKQSGPFEDFDIDSFIAAKCRAGSAAAKDCTGRKGNAQ